MPNHSVLSKARARWGREVFCQLFVRTVRQCVAAIREADAIEEQKLDEPPQKGINRTHISTTDPEATIARGGNAQVSQLSYKHHQAVDDTHGVITAVQTTTGVAGDAAQLPGLVQQHRSQTGRRQRAQ